MIRPILLICLFLFSSYVISSSQPVAASISTQSSLTFDHLEGSTLFFNSSPDASGEQKPQKFLKTNLFDLNYLGVLKSNEGEPYFLFSGRPCQNCLENRTIYAIRPSNPKPITFVYPGKIFEPRTRALVLESRAFFGKCLPHENDVLLVFQKEKVDRRSRMQSSVIKAEISKSYLSERLIEKHLPSINTTLKLVRNKLCREIEGRNRIMLNKPLDLHPRVNAASDPNDPDSPSSSDSEDDEE